VGVGFLGSAASSPNGVRGYATADKRFSCIPEPPDRHLLELVKAKFEGGRAKAPLYLLKSACHFHWLTDNVSSAATCTCHHSPAYVGAKLN